MIGKVVHRIGKQAVIAAVAAIACGITAASLASHGAASQPGSARAVLLSSDTSFHLSGTVRHLIPGITSSLALRVTNPNGFAFTLRTVRVSVTTVPTRCPAANLRISGQAFSGSPPALTVTGLSTRVSAYGAAILPLPILLRRSAANGCQHVRFPFAYFGSATGVPVGQTTVTTLAAYPDPTFVGFPVVLQARVFAPFSPGPRPSGSVTFWQCQLPANLPAHSPASACELATPAGPPVPLTSGRAHLSLANLEAGSYVFFASFNPADTTFALSDSVTVTEFVIG